MDIADEERAALRRLIAKGSIRDVLYRYCRAIDRCDERLLETVFHPDAIESHGGLHEGPALEFCRLAIAYVRKMATVSHYITNIMIDIDGDVAWTESYGLALHRIIDDGGGAFDSIFAARLLDRFESRDGQWRISARRVVYDWNRDSDVRETWGRGFFEGQPQTGSMDRCDPSYTVLAKARFIG